MFQWLVYVLIYVQYDIVSDTTYREWHDICEWHDRTLTVDSGFTYYKLDKVNLYKIRYGETVFAPVLG